VLRHIVESQDLSENLTKQLRDIVAEFTDSFTATIRPG
jgi:hypothetical protein